MTQKFFSKDDTVWGTKYVYCHSHGRVHLTGWCTVPVYDKVPLLGDTMEEAMEEYRMRAFKNNGDKGFYWLYNPEDYK